MSEVWVEPTGRLAHLRDRLQARVHAGLNRAAQRRGSRRAQDSPGQGPRFTVSGFDASFEELEAILWHPDVLDAVERRPAAPLSETVPPAPRLPGGVDRFNCPPRSRPARVYDIVPLALELELLELRLLELDDLVDVFIVVEAGRSYGGLRKPLFLERNRARFARFAGKLRHVVLDDAPLAALFPERRRGPTDFRGEDAFRAAMWHRIRGEVDFEPDAAIILADLDELPPRSFVHWVKHYQVDLPIRLRCRALRYSLRWRDRAAAAEPIVLSPAQFPAIDAAPQRMRHLPGRILGATGAVHLTSSLPPPALVAKFAMTTDWDPGIVPFLRNEHDETAAMMREGRWFERRLTPYDADADVDGLVPWAARANRDRYAWLWERLR